MNTPQPPILNLGNNISLTGGIRQCAIMHRPITHYTGWRNLPDALAIQALNGAYELRLENQKSVIMRHREGVFLPPGIRHELRVIGKASVISQWCHFNLEGWGGICVFDLVTLPIHLPRAKADVVGATIKTAVRCRQHQQENQLKWPLREQVQFFKMAETLLADTRPEIALSRMARFQPFLPILRLMKERLANPPNRSEMASLMGLSESHFHTRFRQAFGKAPVEYLLELRLRRAKEQLIHTGFSIKEISEQCGFDSTSYFCRLFRAKLRLTPAKYRDNFLH